MTKAAKTKKFIKDHRIAITMGVIAAAGVCIYLTVNKKYIDLVVADLALAENALREGYDSFMLADATYLLVPKDAEYAIVEL